MFKQLTSWDNLLLASKKASKGKRGQANVASFEYLLEENLLCLQDELLSQAYRPGKYENFFIHEPKRRLISAAPFRDRVVHHALCNVIEPIFERSFIYDSYANRVGKGTHRALDRCQEFARRFKYVLPCDVCQFFPSIDYAILRGSIARKIHDANVLWLIDLILASGEGVLRDAYDMIYFAGDDLFAVDRPRGLPIGNLTSQFWANVYLNSFDHFVKRELRCTGYLRFVDDILFFDNNKETLWKWKDLSQQRLDQRRLTMHAGAHPRPVHEGVSFLGFIVFPQHRRLKRRRGIHFHRNLRSLFAQHDSGQIPLAMITASVQGWVNHVRYANTIGLRSKILSNGA
ncbi:RNA-dependent DNA polymerase [candidate division KSB1 bacterium]|nr:MAG: RNA-dependent DNA polymerase [candidate division KSB1 bacterium]